MSGKIKKALGKNRLWAERVARNGWQNLLRNKALSIATILIMTLMFFVFNIILALSYASDSVIYSIGRKVDIRAEINPKVEQYTILSLVNELKQLTDVIEVLYVSKDEALKNFGKKYPNIISFLGRNQLQNPLPDVIRITGKDISANSRILAYLERSQLKKIINQDKLRDDAEQKNRNDKILNITQFIKSIGFWLNIVFAIVAALIIFNSISINIHSHRHEINIMRLVGAKKSFIQGGFIFQGIAYAVTALVFSTIFSQIVLLYLSKTLIGIITNESLLVGIDAILLHFDDQFLSTFGWQFLGVVFVGFISSYMAIEHYLRRRFSF